jgi:hypothetical protein
MQVTRDYPYPNLDLSWRPANMAEHKSQPRGPLFAQKELKKRFEISNFDLNAILRGAELTVVGGK